MATAPKNRIEEWRRTRGFSQSDLAERAGTSAPTIARLESGDMKLNVEWMSRLAPALGCLPAELLPAEYYRPYLTTAEARLVNLYRELSDTEQVRWQKAFAAFCAPIEMQDVELTS